MPLPRLLRARSAATGGANDGVVVSECINWTLEYMQKHIYLYWLKEASCNVRCSSYWVVWMVGTATPHPTFALHCMTYCEYLWVKSVVVRYTKSRACCSNEKSLQSNKRPKATPEMEILPSPISPRYSAPTSWPRPNADSRRAWRCATSSIWSFCFKAWWESSPDLPPLIIKVTIILTSALIVMNLIISNDSIIYSTTRVCMQAIPRARLHDLRQKVQQPLLRKEENVQSMMFNNYPNWWCS